MENPLERTRYDWLLEILSLISLVVAFIPVLYYEQLGEGNILPIHYNVSGEIDGWGDRSYILIFLLVATVFYIALSICERFYTKFNIPFKVTSNNATPVYKCCIRLVRHIKLVCIATFAYINITSLAIAMGKGNNLNKYVMMLLVLAMLALVVAYYIKLLTYKE